MSADEKEEALMKWERQWDVFLDQVIGKYANLVDSPLANSI